MSRRDVSDIFRLMTMSVGDLLDDYFETDELKGAYASSGVVGVWAGPYTPGTAYNLLHHALGEVNGVQGAWGHVRGGMGAISEAIAASARASGATIRTSAPVASIDVSGGRTTGVTLAVGRDADARRSSLSGAHPKRTVLDLVGAEHFPAEVAEDMRRYRTRGASVKVNVVLSEPPRYVNADPEVGGAAAGTRASRSARRCSTSSRPGRTPSAASRPPARTSRSRCRPRSTRRSPTTARRSSRCSRSSARGTRRAGPRARARRTATPASTSSPSTRRT